MLLRACQKQLWLHRRELRYAGLTCLGMCLGMELISLAVMLVGDPAEYLVLTPFVALVAACALGLGLSAHCWLVAFPMGLRMGATRREMTAGTGALAVAVAGLALLVAAVYWWLVETLEKSYWANLRGKRVSFDLLGELPWWGWLLALGGCAVGGLLIGALLLRFGRKGFWIMWGGWMLLCLGPQWLLQICPDFSIPVLDAFPWAALGGLLLLLCALAVRALLRLPVRAE